MLKVHDKRFYECELCKTDFNQLQLFQNHQSDIHDLKLICYLCEYKARNDRQMIVHKKRDHEKKQNFICDICDKKFVMIYQLKEHKKKTHDRFRILCELCNHPGFFSKFAVKEHIISVHAGRKHICNTCNKSFWTKALLTHHVKNQHLNTE